MIADTAGQWTFAEEVTARLVYVRRHGSRVLYGSDYTDQMYNVHMKRYTVAQVRQRLAEAFDSAERGEAVVIERRGVRFRLEADRPRRRASSRQVLIEFLDPAVEEGRWSWTWRSGALRFSGGRRRG